MTERRRSIAPKYMPARPPFRHTLIVYLLLTVHDFPGWSDGVLWTGVALLWGAWLQWVLTTDTMHPKDV